MSAIFISYRRSDSQEVAGRIYDRLVSSFSVERIFKDVDNIPLGVSFPAYLNAVLSKARIVLVVIGPTWHDTRDATGRRRLDDPADVVRFEIETSLRLGLTVIPVLVSNATFRSPDELPESMRELALRNGISVRPDPDFHSDMSRLIRRLEDMVGEGPAVSCDAAKTNPPIARPNRADVSESAMVEPPAGASPASIAVLPLVNMTPDKDNEYFGDGVSEEILNALARVPGIMVSARSSSFAFKGRHENVREIGRLLNVSYALEGSVRKAGNRLRISTRLIKVADGFQVWSENFDRQAEDILDIQDEVARKVVETLKTKLLPEDRRIVAARGTMNLEAYDFHLRGRFQLNKRSPEGFKQALRNFALAIDKDPDYAAPHGSMGACYILMVNYDVMPSSEAIPQCRAAVARALELDRELAEPHVVMGLLKSQYDWDWPAAEKSMRTAIALNPNFATAHHWYSTMLGFRNLAAEAWDQGQKAEQLDPMSLIIKVSNSNLLAYQKRYDDALRRIRGIFEIDPGFPPAMYSMALICLLMEDFDQAGKAIEAIRAMEGDTVTVVSLQGYLYAKTGKFDDAWRMKSKLSEISDAGPMNVETALIQVGLSETDQALDSLEKAVAHREVNALELPAVPWWDPLRKDPRFEALLQRLDVKGSVKGSYER